MHKVDKIYCIRDKIHFMKQTRYTVQNRQETLPKTAKIKRYTLWHRQDALYETLKETKKHCLKQTRNCIKQTSMSTYFDGVFQSLQCSEAWSVSNQGRFTQAWLNIPGTHPNAILGCIHPSCHHCQTQCLHIITSQSYSHHCQTQCLHITPQSCSHHCQTQCMHIITSQSCSHHCQTPCLHIITLQSCSHHYQTHSPSACTYITVM